MPNPHPSFQPLDPREPLSPDPGTTQTASSLETATSDVSTTSVDPRVALLHEREPRALLADMLKDDPFGLRKLARDYVDEEAVLLDEGRLFLRLAARVAHGSLRSPIGGSAGIDSWLAELTRRAATSLLVEDKEALETGIPPSETWDPVSPSLLERLPIEPGLARAVAVTFNRLPHRERRIFYSLVIRGTSIDECAAETRMTPQSLRSLVRDVLHRLCRLEKGEAQEGGRV